jgi:outer membrane protein assembly factor BamB
VKSTKTHFFGCFFNTSAGVNTVVEISLANSPQERPVPFSMRVFDFSPRTVTVTSNFQIIDYKRKGHVHHSRDGDDHDLVSFLVSNFKNSPVNPVGSPFLVSVRAGGTVVYDKSLDVFGLKAPAAFVTASHLGFSFVSDGSSKVLCIRSDNGGLVWTAEIPHNVSLKSETFPLSTVMSLGLFDSIVYSQTVESQDIARVASVDVQFGKLRHVFLEAQAVASTQPVDVDGKLYVAKTAAILVFNSTSGSLLQTIPIGAPIFRFDAVTAFKRLVFGTKYSIFSLPMN